MTEQAILLGKLSKAAFALIWIPFIFLVSLALVDKYAAVWTSFGFSVFAMACDYLFWHVKLREYPMILSTWSLLAYILNIFLAYLSPEVSSAYYGPIVISVLFGAILLSILFEEPFSLQFQKGLEQDSEILMERLEVKLTHMWLSKLFLIVFAVMLVCSFCSTLFTQTTGDAEYIILGLVIPIILPLVGVCFIPLWMKLMPYHKHVADNAAGMADKDEEKYPFLEKSAALKL